MPAHPSKTPSDLGPTTPQDLYPTSDIRFVISEISKLEERVNNLISENKHQRSDITKLLLALVAGFLILAGMLITGYLNLVNLLYLRNRFVEYQGHTLTEFNLLRNLRAVKVLDAIQ